MAVTQQYREAGIKTPLGDDALLLREMTMNEELGRLFTMNLELASETENIRFEDLLGQKVTVRLELPSGEKRYFNGHVSQISQLPNKGSYAIYNAVVHPWLWFLTRTSDCRIFQNKTVPDIIKEVFRNHGYTDFEEKLSASYRNWEYCVQYRETDFNFVSRLMEQEGIYYYFKHDEDKHTLILSDGYGAHEKISGYETIPYYPPDETTVREEESVSSWYLSKKIQPGSYALNDYDFLRPKADLKASSSISHEHTGAEFEVYDYPGEYVEADDGDAYARKRIEELNTQYEEAQGESNARGIMAGGLFGLSEYPREDQNREYLVVTATHHIRSDDFDSGADSSGPVYTNNFSVIESRTAFRTARTTPKPAVQGPQTAVVVGPSGEEIYTDEHGRVKLQFHWDRYGQFDENSSCWVRVSQIHAGKGFGGIDTPRIGEEVIVEFLEGDPDRPIITGRVYNGDNTPPNELPSAKVVSGMKSNSTPGGGGNNAIMLDDTKGKENLTVHAQKDMNTTVENDRNTTLVGGNDSLTVSAGTRSVTVKGNTSLTVQAGDRTVNVTGSYKLDTTSEINMQAPAKITLTCGGSSITMVPGKITISAGGGAGIVLDANALTKSSAGSEVLLDGKATMSSPAESKVDAPTSVLSGGGSTVKADAGGVAVTGPKVSLNG